jgi:transposase
LLSLPCPIIAPRDGRRQAPFTERLPRVLEPWADAGKAAVIPPRSNRLAPHDFNRELYKERHLIENFFCKLKQFRAIATRDDKTARNFLAAIHLAAAIIWLN